MSTSADDVITSTSAWPVTSRSLAEGPAAAQATSGEGQGKDDGSTASRQGSKVTTTRADDDDDGGLRRQVTIDKPDWLMPDKDPGQMSNADDNARCTTTAQMRRQAKQTASLQAARCAGADGGDGVGKAALAVALATESPLR